MVRLHFGFALCLMVKVTSHFSGHVVGVRAKAHADPLCQVEIRVMVLHPPMDKACSGLLARLYGKQLPERLQCAAGSRGRSVPPPPLVAIRTSTRHFSVSRVLFGREDSMSSAPNSVSAAKTWCSLWRTNVIGLHGTHWLLSLENSVRATNITEFGVWSRTGTL